MNWKSVNFLIATTTTAVIASQVVKKLYKYFTSTPSSTEYESKVANGSCTKDREINDVIVFSDDSIDEVSTCENRQQNCRKLMKYIKSARETLDVCMYLITSNEIAEQIIRLGQRHVLVRIMVDNDMAYAPPSQIRKLKEYSFIKVETNDSALLMHHKFCIVDGPLAIQRKNKLKAQAEALNIYGQIAQKHEGKNDPKRMQVKGFVMSGSLNWSTQAMVSNYDSVIVTSNATIVRKFEHEFKTLWPETEENPPKKMTSF